MSSWENIFLIKQNRMDKGDTLYYVYWNTYGDATLPANTLEKVKVGGFLWQLDAAIWLNQNWQKLVTDRFERECLSE